MLVRQTDIASRPFAHNTRLDTAYVLAYSTILLNTDAHNPQVKRRMTLTDFIKNNRGINDNADLPDELLSSIYQDIVSNEIRMKDEVESAAPVIAHGPGLVGAIANVGRDFQKEAYMMQSNNMTNKTEVSSYHLHSLLLSGHTPHARLSSGR